MPRCFSFNHFSLYKKELVHIQQNLSPLSRVQPHAHLLDCWKIIIFSIIQTINFNVIVTIDWFVTNLINSLDCFCRRKNSSSKIASVTWYLQIQSHHQITNKKGENITDRRKTIAKNIVSTSNPIFNILNLVVVGPVVINWEV